MKKIAYIICCLKTLPLIIELEMQNFTEHLKRFSEVEKRAIEKYEIIETIKTLDLSKEDIQVALNNAISGDYKETIQSLVQYIHKNIK